MHRVTDICFGSSVWTEINRKIKNNEYIDEDSESDLALLIWQYIENGRDSDVEDIFKELPTRLYNSVLEKVLKNKNPNTSENIIQTAVQQNCSKSLSRLLDNEIAIDLVHEGKTPALIYAVIDSGHKECYDVLMSKKRFLGLDLHTRDINGNTALMMAIDCGNTKCAIDLINRGADVDLLNKQRQSALMFATKQNNIEVVTIIADIHRKMIAKNPIKELERLRSLQIDSRGLTPLHYAVQAKTNPKNKYFRIIKNLIYSLVYTNDRPADFIPRDNTNQRLVACMFESFANAQSDMYDLSKECARTKRQLAASYAEIIRKNEQLAVAHIKIARSDRSQSSKLIEEVNRLKAESSELQIQIPQILREASELERRSERYSDMSDNNSSKASSKKIELQEQKEKARSGNQEDFKRFCDKPEDKQRTIRCAPCFRLASRVTGCISDCSEEACTDKCSFCGAFCNGYCQTISECYGNDKTSSKYFKAAISCNPLCPVGCAVACTVATVAGCKDAIQSESNKVGVLNEETQSQNNSNNEVVTEQPQSNNVWSTSNHNQTFTTRALDHPQSGYSSGRY